MEEIFKRENILFSTKANILLALKPNLKKSKIEELFFFSITDWKNKKKEILDKIKDIFFPNKIIIRSSAIGEDSLDKSMAGCFESIQNINPGERLEVKTAIEEIINSYKNKSSESSFNQVLVQSQAKDIVMSGVIFTRSPETNSPYYILNYDNTSGSTHTVTSGLENKAIKISHFTNLEYLSKDIKSLIEAIKEIESLVPNTGLDIEFAINKKGEIITFQVRPLTILSRKKFEDYEIKNLINHFKEKFWELGKKKIHLFGEKTILADMPDWNPAEIIGDSPDYLAYSLYDYLITNNAWHEARTSQGYYNVNPAKLVVLIGNKPYVDVRNSFNSFIPNSISKTLYEKLISFYLNKIEKNPELQDKVEFDILFTCYDLCFEDRSKELLKEGFTKEEIEELKESLINLTNNLIIKSDESIKEDLYSLEKMKKSRINLKDKCTYKDPVFYILEIAKFLLDDCREKGTVQFSRLARLGFIGKILLKSLVKNKIIDNEFYDNFMASLNTITADFKKDLILMKEGKIQKENFIKKYCHLRPGSYDITSLRYEDNPHLLKILGSDIPKDNVLKEFSINSTIKKEIDQKLKEHGLDFCSLDLFNFVKYSLEAREYSKFEFTKNLSDAIELIALAGKLMGFNREELAMLDVDCIFSDIKNKYDLAEKWKKIILERRKQREINEMLEFPPIIFSERDFDIVKYYTPKPNYITQKKVQSKLLNLNENLDENEVEGKIILIENGDPGYDWIFTRNPTGLITKYGGVASHMSIRCAEFGIPAAIGCGSLYDKIIKFREVILDCKLKKIFPLDIKKC